MEWWFKETKQGLKCDYIWLLGVAIETNFSKNTPERSIELTGPGWKRDQLWKKPLGWPTERDGTHFCSFFGVHVFSKAGRSRSPKLEREREERERESTVEAISASRRLSIVFFVSNLKTFFFWFSQSCGNWDHKSLLNFSLNFTLIIENWPFYFTFFQKKNIHIWPLLIFFSCYFVNYCF